MAPRTYLQLPALAPQTSSEWIQLHKELYNYYTLRRKLLDIETQSLQLHFIISRAGQERLGKQELTCLYHLQEVAASSRYQLQATTLESTICTKIKQLCHISQVLTEAKLPVYKSCLLPTDTRLTSQVSLILEQIDPSQFQENLDFILSCNDTRPPAALLYKGRTTTDYKQPILPTSRRALRIQAGRFRRHELLHDNIFHSQALFNILQNDTFPTAIPRPEIEKLWLQILSLIAICRGCTSEPSFFLSTLDRLLDNLRSAYG
jgi:hypothetical protein